MRQIFEKNPQVFGSMTCYIIYCSSSALFDWSLMLCWFFFLKYFSAPMMTLTWTIRLHTGRGHKVHHLSVVIGHLHLGAVPMCITLTSSTANTTMIFVSVGRMSTRNLCNIKNTWEGVEEEVVRMSTTSDITPSPCSWLWWLLSLSLPWLCL